MMGRARAGAADVLSRISTGWIVAALLLAVCVLCYGYWIPRLGLYWDDWWLIWAAETGGAARVLDGLVGERLLHGLMYVLTTALYDASPEALHLLVLATRWTTALAAWWTVRAIWPERGLEALGVALLVVVYPGFSQQSLALIYSDYFLTLTFFLVSLGGMLWAMRSPRRFRWLFGVSLLAAIPAHWVLEYWLGLELLRLPLALAVARQRAAPWDAWKRAAAFTAPFYANVAVKVIAALDFQPRDGSGETLGAHLATIAADPGRELFDRLGYVLSDLGSALVFAWSRALQPGVAGMRLRYVIAAVLLVAVAAAVTAALMRVVERSSSRDWEGWVHEPARWSWMAMAVGLAAVVVGQLPLWVTDRHIQWEVAALDRHSLPALFGAALFTTGLARLLLSRTQAFIAGIALLVGVGASFQFRQGHEYWQEHERQASFMWQWHWRAPGLEPGTSLFLHHEPVSLPQSKDYTYAVPLNLVHDPEYEAGPVQYWVFPYADGFPYYWLMLVSGGDPRLQEQLSQVALVESGTTPMAELERHVRNLVFTGSTDRSVLVLHRPPGCLRVLDPRRDAVVDLPPVVRAARLRSRPELIRAEGTQSVETLRRYYGPEPERGWCYYYQKAELARQTGDWARVAELADEVRQRALAPADDREWSTFIEGYVRAGRAEEAERLVRDVVPYGGSRWDLHDRYARQRAFCELERRLSSEGLLDGPAADVFALDDAGVLPCVALDSLDRRTP